MFATIRTAVEVAEYLDLTPRRVRQLATAGILRGRKMGEVWLFEEEDVYRYEIVRHAEKSARDALRKFTDTCHAQDAHRTHGDAARGGEARRRDTKRAGHGTLGRRDLDSRTDC